MASTPTALDTFLYSYATAALWSSTDEEGVALDESYSVEDLHPSAIQSMEADCEDFLNGAMELIDGELEQAGHDFWLTRNRHGCGFWDGDWPEEAGRLLTERSHPYGESYLYVGDNGKLFVG
jgi:hypothetical protein